MKEKNLAQRYGENSYVLISDATCQAGVHFSLEFAKRGFNLILVSRNVIKLDKLEVFLYEHRTKSSQKIDIRCVTLEDNIGAEQL